MAVIAAANRAELSDADLSRIARLVYERSGITLHDGKRELIVARLQKRLRALGLDSYGEYLRRVETDATGAELTALLDAIATNHTYFFREEEHFTFLTQRIVPEWRAERRDPLRMWCAACSTGQEPYTIASCLGSLDPPCDFEMLASDLSTKALATARAGVYKVSDLSAVPPDILRKSFEKGLGAQEGLARIHPALQRKIAFRQLNLLEVTQLGRQFDVIFCRNVMIYFDRAVQQRVVAMLERHLAPGGYLFISHSESLNAVTHQLRWIAPAVYRRVPNA
jgi:chemotaxis protein methyltransferase CheR